VNSSTEPPAIADGIRGTWSSELGARLRTGIGLNLTATVFNQGSTFAVNLVVANLLGRERFGEYTMVLATVATLGTLGQLSMGYTATKYLAEFRTSDPERASRILSLCAITAAVSAALAALCLVLPAPTIAARVLDAPHLTLALRLSAAAVFFMVLNGFLTGTLAGLESYRAIARAGLASGTLYFVCCVLLAWRGGLEGAVAGVALAAAAQCALLALLVKQETARHHIHLTARELGLEHTVVSRFAVPASANGFLSLPAIWGATALLAAQTDGYQQVALFGAANTFRTMVLFLPQTINTVGMSVINNESRSGPGSRRVFWLNAALTAATALAVAALIVAGAPWLLGMFGPEFVEGRFALTILLGAALVEAAAIATYQIVIARGWMWQSFFMVSLPRASALVLISALLAPVWGAAGLATAYVVAWSLSLAGILLLVGRLDRR
jgi:O-antigen/teichoic acid export membrane protein